MKGAKKQIETKLESQNNCAATRWLWQGSHAIIGYNGKPYSMAANNASFPVSLFVFNASFQHKFSGMTLSAPTTLGAPITMFTIADAKSIFLRLNLQEGTEEVSGSAFKGTQGSLLLE